MWFPSLRATAQVTSAVGMSATSRAKTTGRNRARRGDGRTARLSWMLADAGILRWLHSGRNVCAAAETEPMNLEETIAVAIGIVVAITFLAFVLFGGFGISLS